MVDRSQTGGQSPSPEDNFARDVDDFLAQILNAKSSVDERTAHATYLDEESARQKVLNSMQPKLVPLNRIGYESSCEEACSYWQRFMDVFTQKHPGTKAKIEEVGIKSSNEIKACSITTLTNSDGFYVLPFAKPVAKYKDLAITTAARSDREMIIPAHSASTSLEASFAVPAPAFLIRTVDLLRGDDIHSWSFHLALSPAAMALSLATLESGDKDNFLFSHIAHMLSHESYARSSKKFPPAAFTAEVWDRLSVTCISPTPDLRESLCAGEPREYVAVAEKHGLLDLTINYDPDTMELGMVNKYHCA